MNKTKSVILLVATLAFGVAPFITPPFTGYDPGMFPVRVERPFIQPAGYAFAIWSVIYLWLFAHAIYGAVFKAEDPAWDRIRWPMIVAVGIGSVWLAIAGSSPLWATVTIWIMAAAAVTALLWADPKVDRWMLCAPAAILAGWLSAAAAVSLGVVIAGYGLLDNTSAAGTMLALVLAIAVTVQMRVPKMPVYGLTVIWALAGVVAVNLSDARTVAVMAASGIAVMLVTLWAARKA